MTPEAVSSERHSTAPAERYRAVERVRHGRAGLLRREIRRLQLEVPARLAVGVVDQTHARLYFQARLLPLDDGLILRDEALAEKVQQRRNWKPAEQIPR